MDGKLSGCRRIHPFRSRIEWEFGDTSAGVGVVSIDEQCAGAGVAGVFRIAAGDRECALDWRPDAEGASESRGRPRDRGQMGYSPNEAHVYAITLEIEGAL